MEKIVRFKTTVSLLICVSLLFLSASWMTITAQDHSHGTFEGNPHAELERESPVELNPEGGSEIGFVFEAYLSPQQEGGEEENTPPFVPAVFQSTEPSVPREERPSRGHAVLEFTKDLSRAYVHLAVVNVDPKMWLCCTFTVVAPVNWVRSSLILVSWAMLVNI